jgi:hypothetical protein
MGTTLQTSNLKAAPIGSNEPLYSNIELFATALLKKQLQAADMINGKQ